MAKIKAHGAIVGTVELTISADRYMSDGTILRNRGQGWKLAGKVKPEFTPQEAFARRSRRVADILAARPALAAYRKALHDLCGLCKRWKVDMAISMMPDDCDGVWSEVADGYGDNVSADVDEIADLCRLYLAAQREGKAMREAAEAAT